MQIHKGNIITSASYDELRIIEQGYIVVKDGFIEDVSDTLKPEYEKETLIDHKEKLILPAFSDLHMHAPQYPQRGIGMDCLLFDWLSGYTFPQESNYKDIQYAKSVYARLVREFLRQGSFHLSLFTTIHYDACDLLYRMLNTAEAAERASLIISDDE